MTSKIDGHASGDGDPANEAIVLLKLQIEGVGRRISRLRRRNWRHADASEDGQSGRTARAATASVRIYGEQVTDAMFRGSSRHCARQRGRAQDAAGETRCSIVNRSVSLHRLARGNAEVGRRRKHACAPGSAWRPA
jgi:hypothetical protein